MISIFPLKRGVVGSDTSEGFVSFYYGNLKRNAVYNEAVMSEFCCYLQIHLSKSFSLSQSNTMWSEWSIKLTNVVSLAKFLFRVYTLSLVHIYIKKQKKYVEQYWSTVNSRLSAGLNGAIAAYNRILRIIRNVHKNHYKVMKILYYISCLFEVKQYSKTSSL